MIEWIECYHIEWGNYTLRNMCLWNSNIKFTAVLNHLGVDLLTNQRPGKSFCVGQPEEGKLHSRAILPIYIFRTGNLFKGISPSYITDPTKECISSGQCFLVDSPIFPNSDCMSSDHTWWGCSISNSGANPQLIATYLAPLQLLLFQFFPSLSSHFAQSELLMPLKTTRLPQNCFHIHANFQLIFSYLPVLLH